MKRRRQGIRVEWSIEHAKFERVFSLIHLLRHGRYTVIQLAKILKTSDRTIHRYLNLIETVGFTLECDFEVRYFIVEQNCPLCGLQPTTTKENENTH